MFKDCRISVQNFTEKQAKKSAQKLFRSYIFTYPSIVSFFTTIFVFILYFFYFYIYIGNERKRTLAIGRVGSEKLENRKKIRNQDKRLGESVEPYEHMFLF